MQRADKRHEALFNTAGLASLNEIALKSSLDRLRAAFKNRFSRASPFIADFCNKIC
jgi:hypothetical protein